MYHETDLFTVVYISHVVTRYFFKKTQTRFADYDEYSVYDVLNDQVLWLAL